VRRIRQAHSGLSDEVAKQSVERADDRGVTAELERTMTLDEAHSFGPDVPADYA
jgi:hypothetical protein